MITDSAGRKDLPLARGVLDYFPDAIVAIATLSKAGNDKHNPGEDLHWARGKSMDHADCIMRHLIERGQVDTDGISHSVKVAWRALALLQEELEAQGAPMARGARLPESEKTAFSAAAGICGKLSPNGGMYYCTLEPSHKGVHIAGKTGIVWARAS